MSTAVDGMGAPPLPPINPKAVGLQGEVLDPMQLEETGKGKGKPIATYVVITVLILAVIGGLVALGLTGQFTSDGWLCKVAFPAIKKGFEEFGHWVYHTVFPAIDKFMHMKANLTVGQGLLYIGLPVVSAAAIIGLGRKYGPGAVDYLKAKHAEHQAEKANDVEIKRILADQAKECEDENKAKSEEKTRKAQLIVRQQAQRIADRRGNTKVGRPQQPVPTGFLRSIWNSISGSDTSFLNEKV